MRPIRWLLALVLLLPCAAIAGCASSPESLESAVRDLPGVVSVAASEVEGDDAVPFENIPKEVAVMMDSSATTAEIQRIFDAYADEGDNLDGIEVVFQGDGDRTMFYGTDPSAKLIDDFVAAHADRSVWSYRLNGNRETFRVEITLAPTTFGGVMAQMERHRQISGKGAVTIESGGFIIIWDPIDEDTAVTQARIDFARAADESFGLVGANITGSTALALFVDPQGQREAEAWVGDRNTPTVGRVVVNPKGEPPY